MDLQNWQRKCLLVVVGCLAFLVAAGTLISSFQWINRPFPGFFLYANRAVAPDFLPQWSGSREGLRFLDSVVAVQGQKLTDPQLLYDLVRKSPAGSQFEYLIEREGKRFSLSIPSMRFSFHDWLLSFGLYLVAAVGFLVIGLTPFYLRSMSPATSPLFFMVSMIFLWFASTFDFMTTHFLPKEARIFAFTMTPSAGIHLGILLTQGANTGKRHWPYILAVYAVSIVLGMFYSLAFFAEPEIWHWALRLAYAYSCLAAFIFLAILWAELRRPITDLERLRLRVVLFGAILGFFLPTLGTVLVTLFSWEIPYNLLLIPVVFFPLSVAYALLKYNLFDLDLILKVGITRGALTGALLLIYVLVVSLLNSFMGMYEKDLFVPLLFSVLVVLVFNPLLRWIEGLVNHYLFHKEYDPIQLQSKISSLLRTLSRPRTTAGKYLKLIANEVGIETAILSFRFKEEEKFLALSLDGEIPDDSAKFSHIYSTWIRTLGVGKRGVSRDEVESDPIYQESRSELLSIFSELKAELLISINFEDNIFGFISLGKKRSGREYSGDDFRLFCSLTDQLALSLENGMLFEESDKAKENYRLLYDQSQAMNRALVEASQLKKQFVANISHELRTPISTILGYSEVLSDPGFAGDRQVILERVVTNGQELSHLMDSLLDFSQIETGGLVGFFQEVSLREVSQSLAMMATRLIRERPINFRLNLELPTDVIETDAKKLQQILTHLLTNALKFTEKGEIALEVRSRIRDEDPFIEIAVSDTGIGISRENQDVIFEDFRQLDGSSTRQYGGTGLGLSLCRQLAQSLGGRIEVQSEIGQGSVFSFILPAKRTQSEVAVGLEVL